MALNLLNCLRFSNQLVRNVRAFSSYQNNQMDGNKAFTVEDSVSMQKLSNFKLLLSKHNFDETQVESIVSTIGDYVMRDNVLSVESIEETIDCWRSCVRPPNIKPNQLDKLSTEDIDYHMAIDLNTVIAKIEPHLLLMNSQSILKRVNNIKELGIIGGRNDLWRVFVYAPKAYYMQHWHDFLKKFHYLNSKVLDWLLDARGRDALHPHPLIRNARVFELPFDVIRCRFLFAERTGLKSINVRNKLSQVEFVNKIDLRDIMLTTVDKYLQLIAPNCTVEEYNVFERMLLEREDDEDEKIIEDLIELKSHRYEERPKKNIKIQAENEVYQITDL